MTAMDDHDFAAAVAKQRLLPVLRIPDAAAAAGRAAALIRAGLRVVELTTTTNDWPDAVRAVTGSAVAGGFAGSARTASYGGDAAYVMIGVGTVTTEEQAWSAIEAGARFLVSPFPVPAVRGVAAEACVPLVEGGFTPAEIADAAARGPAKVFPAHVGGPAFIRSLLAVLPGARLIPTGGIPVDQAVSYLAAGAIAVGVGSGLPSDPAALAGLLGAAA
jgi:2-dehydro-3-deoxyphosphogluconate aldolase/(4S)-4-hydroxy-2-oxoglutarate aldolase